MIEKPCYECFSSDNEVQECIEGMDEDYNCLVLKKGGCWDSCASGKKSSYYISELDIEKARHKKAVEIREAIEDYLFDINRYLDMGKYFQKDKGQITKIIKKHL